MARWNKPPETVAARYARNAKLATGVSRTGTPTKQVQKLCECGAKFRTTAYLRKRTGFWNACHICPKCRREYQTDRRSMTPEEKIQERVEYERQMKAMTAAFSRGDIADARRVFEQRTGAAWN